MQIRMKILFFLILHIDTSWFFFSLTERLTDMLEFSFFIWFDEVMVGSEEGGDVLIGLLLLLQCLLSSSSGGRKVKRITADVGVGLTGGGSSRGRWLSQALLSEILVSWLGLWWAGFSYRRSCSNGGFFCPACWFVGVFGHIVPGEKMPLVANPAPDMTNWLWC